MSTYQTDEEQLEEIKKWWKDNGKSIIGGAVLGLALVGGWQGWQEYSRSQAETASAYFEQFMQAATTGDEEGALAQGGRLVGQSENSTYAVFTALEMAKIQYQKGDTDAAKLQLHWVIDKAGDEALKQIARLRLARLLLDSKDIDGAQAIIAVAPEDAFAGEFALLSGDIAMLRSDRESARVAYLRALALGVGDQALVQMKLVEAGGS